MVDSAYGNNYSLSPWVPTQHTAYQQAAKLSAKKKGRESWLLTHRPMFGVDTTEETSFDPTLNNWTAVDQTAADPLLACVLVGLGVLLRAVSYYLDRFGLAIGSGKLIDGITYTDANARIPSKNILIYVAILCALLFFASIFIRSWALPAMSLGLLGVASILIGAIWPAVMQGFQVNPSEPDKEGKYIARNIKATRDAYDVADVKVESYSANTTLTPAELAASAESRVSTRLLDPTLISPAFEQLQQVRGYYQFPDVLDVDRYTIDGQETDAIVTCQWISAVNIYPSGTPISISSSVILTG